MDNKVEASWLKEFEDGFFANYPDGGIAAAIIQNHFPEKLFRYGSFDKNDR